MKNKKKILARIGAVIAVALIVASLAIPAFADKPTATAEGDTRATVNLGSAQAWFEALLSPDAYNDAYKLLWDRYLGMGNIDFFNQTMLVSGRSYAQSVSLGIDLSANGSTDYLSGTLYTDVVAFKIVTDNQTQVYEAFDGGRFEYSLYFSAEDGYMLNISYYTAQSTNVPMWNVRYRKYAGDSADTLLRESVTYNGTEYVTQNPTIELAFTVDETSTEDSGILSLIVFPLLQDGVRTANFTEIVYNPADFYQALNDAYNLGYDDGYRFGYSNGYSEGYEVGLEEGYAQAVDGDAYQAGYDKALSEIDSGQFGKNLIGGMLRAPMDMLRNFTLIEWTTNTGTEVVINLATLFTAVISVSLFIWFLKLFAGG